MDLTPRSIETAVYATSLARRLGGQLLFLHSSRIGWPFDRDRIQVRDAIMDLTHPADRILFRRGGGAAPVIIETAYEEKVDIILMASSKKPFLTRLFDGSVTAHVLRGAPCPVWAALDQLVPLTLNPIRNIVCEASGPVLDFAANLGDRLDARVFIRDNHRVVELTPVHYSTRGSTALLPDPVDVVHPDLLVVPRRSEPKFFGDLRTPAYERACHLGCPVACV